MKLCVEALSIQEPSLLVICLLWLHLVGFENGQGQAGEDDMQFEGKVMKDLIEEPVEPTRSCATEQTLPIIVLFCT